MRTPLDFYFDSLRPAREVGSDATSLFLNSARYRQKFWIHVYFRKFYRLICETLRGGGRTGFRFKRLSMEDFNRLCIKVYVETDLTTFRACCLC